MKYYQNGWNWCHLMGGGLMFWMLVFIFNMNVYFAFWLAPLPTVCKEIGDQIAKTWNTKWMFKIGFDPAGGDFKDVLMAAVGMLIALIFVALKFGG